MATTAITVEQLKRNTFDVDALEMTAATTAEDGFLVDVSGTPDQKLLLVFQNNGVSAATATIKAGNGLQGVEDLISDDIATGKFAAISVESGKFAIVSGDNKGKIHVIPSDTGLEMAAIALP